MTLESRRPGRSESVTLAQRSPAPSRLSLAGSEGRDWHGEAFPAVGPERDSLDMIRSGLSPRPGRTPRPEGARGKNQDRTIKVFSRVLFF